MIKTRFAPSPTGYLHIGNARIAIIAWLFAKKNHGELILRIDDTNSHKIKEYFIDEIKKDLDWLNITYNTIFQQSNRIKQYNIAKNKLIKIKRLYPCFETKYELSIKRKKQLQSGLPPIYNRSSLLLNKYQVATLKQCEYKPYWRFYLNDNKIFWHDHIKGKLQFKSSKLNDPIVIKNNTNTTYSLASAIDDIEYSITDIIRGEDHISNSAIQIQIFRAMQTSPPNFAHLPLMTLEEKKISKREGGYTIRNIRNNDILPDAVIIYLSKIGSSKMLTYNCNTKNLIKTFSFNKINNASVTYDNRMIINLNTKIIRTMTCDQIKSLLSKNISEKLWNIAKYNIINTKEITLWNKILDDNLKPIRLQDRALLKIAFEQLPKCDISNIAYKKWIENIKKNTNKRGKELFIPIRLALTGMTKGPKMTAIITVLGRKKIIQRLLMYNNTILTKN